MVTQRSVKSELFSRLFLQVLEVWKSSYGILRSKGFWVKGFQIEEILSDGILISKDFERRYFDFQGILKSSKSKGNWVTGFWVRRYFESKWKLSNRVLKSKGFWVRGFSIEGILSKGLFDIEGIFWVTRFLTIEFSNRRDFEIERILSQGILRSKGFWVKEL